MILSHPDGYINKTIDPITMLRFSVEQIILLGTNNFHCENYVITFAGTMNPVENA